MASVLQMWLGRVAKRCYAARYASTLQMVGGGVMAGLRFGTLTLCGLIDLLVIMGILALLQALGIC